MSASLISDARPAQILLVDDNDNDVELTKLAFEHAKLTTRLHRVGNGEECMKFLRKEAPYGAAPTPDLILLDLNMPRMDGIEVLTELNKDERLKHLIVVVLTSSKADEDVLESYKLRCNSYLTKPVNFESFAALVQSLNDYWFTVVVLPPKRA